MPGAGLPPPGARGPRRVARCRGGAPRRAGTAAGAAPSEPWRADHAWRPEGARDETGREVRGLLVGGGLLTVAASAMGALVLGDAEPALVPLLALGAFLLAGLGLLGLGVLQVLRRARHGVVELRFARFPFFLGEPLDATLVRDGATARLEGLQARLTCVTERWSGPEDTDPSERRGTRRLERVERWSEARSIPGGAGARAAIRFELPLPGPEVPGTALSADPPRYWELEVWADLPGLDFQAVFLVPVYQRPTPAPAAPPPPA